MAAQANITDPTPHGRVKSGHQSASPPRIYMIHPLLAGPLEQWSGLLDHAAGLGFSHVLSAPIFAGPALDLPLSFEAVHGALGWSGSAEDALRHFAAEARARGLTPLLDLLPGAVADGGPIAREQGALFLPNPAHGALDPRRYGRSSEAALADWPHAAAGLGDFWAARLGAWERLGIGGFRIDLAAIPRPCRRGFIEGLRAATAAELLGWTPGLARDALAELQGAGLDATFCSLPWWDYRAEWLWDELAALRAVAPVIAPVEAPFGPRLAAQLGDAALLPAAQARALHAAVSLAEGLLLPMGFETGEARSWSLRLGRAETQAPTPPRLAETIRAANAMAAKPGRGAARLLSAPAAPAIALLREGEGAPRGAAAALYCLNPALKKRHSLALGPLLAASGGRFQAPSAGPAIVLDPGALARLDLLAEEPARPTPPALDATAREAAGEGQRIAIEAVSPAVDGGLFPVKRLAGEMVTVAADLLCDGHDKLAAVLLHRRAGEAQWTEVPMALRVNDRWEAAFPLAGIGLHEFAVEAWRDVFATYRDELTKKHQAGLDLGVELMEGRGLIEAAGAPLQPVLERFDAMAPAAQIALLLSQEVAALMAAADPRPFRLRSPVFQVDADRRESQFASWYEIFPRSMSDDPARHGTFRDVERHLPRIRAMGFDVLYFPPIHPIGRANRKGRNNSLDAGPDDPGSPYAIGSAEGGHDALHPELGSFEDFRHLIAAAAASGLEIALDFAIQCSPDHPWLAEHPGWFDWRPDGSIKYAENPPKKYQDIVNVDFYARDAVPDLWVALARVVLFWCEQGIRIFRVDNPHTKPFPFWEWMIAQVRARYPGTLFLAEAFTRPKIMNRLAKIGFNQSYTYFTWRNERAELEEYLASLNEGPEADFFRPNFFVNTPDINPVFLQTSGRAGHLIRACLAATLSGLWGVYSGFELCEATPLPGREEYLDSEKYQLKQWDWQRPGNIVAEITLLNRLRRRNPALQSHLGLRFLPSDNPQVMIYERATPDRSNVIIVAVSLDPFNPQAANTEIPFYRWGIADDGSMTLTDLVPDRPARWQGKWQRITLDPSFPFALWRVEAETF
ncbi:maltotransferase domain-containing protein [Acidisoma sp. C75]